MMLPPPNPMPIGGAAPLHQRPNSQIQHRTTYATLTTKQHYYLRLFRRRESRSYSYTV